MLELLQTVDGTILLAIQQLRLELLTPLVKGYTGLGDSGLMWIVLSLAMVCWKPTRKAGVLGLLALALGALCTNMVLKPLVARPRPFLDVVGLVSLIAEPDPHSFPSGHTCAAFAAGMIWARALPKGWMRVLAVVLAVGMGLSRLYVGVHYPSDVLAGAAVGAFSAWFVWRVAQRQEKKIRGQAST